MHQYKIEVFAYTAEGAVGNLITTRYADNPEQARLICAEYENQYGVAVDEEGNEYSTGSKVYQVRLHLLCYKLCQDKTMFFAQFQA